MGIRPPTVDGKVRVKCYACGYFGDIFDILEILFPLESYPEQQLRVRDLQQELIKLQGSNGTLSLKGRQALRTGATQRIVSNLWHEFQNQFECGHEHTIWNQLERRCQDEGISVDAVLDFDRDHKRSEAESLRNHIAECDDYFCGKECRTARGLPPLTPVEIEQHRRECEQEKKEREQAIIEQQERIAKAMRNVRSR